MNSPNVPEQDVREARKWARSGLLFFAVSFFLSAATHATVPDLKSHRLFNLALLAVFVGLMMTGLVLSLLAIRTLRFGKDTRAMITAIVGAVVNAVSLAVIVTTFISGFQKGYKSAKITRGLRQLGSNYQAELRQSYDPKRGLMNVHPERLDRMRESLNQASTELSGDQAAMTRTMSDYVAAMQQKLKDYEAAAANLKDAKVLSTETLTTKTQIEERRKVVQDLLTANQDIKDFFSNSESTIRSNLAKAKVPENLRDSVITGFRRGLAKRNDIINKIRDCDDRMGQAMLSVLDLLEAQWGKWSYQPQSKRLLFRSTETLRTYQALLKEINAAGEEQIRLQGELVQIPAQK